MRIFARGQIITILLFVVMNSRHALIWWQNSGSRRAISLGWIDMTKDPELSIADQRHIFKYQRDRGDKTEDKFYLGMRGRILDLVDGSVDVIKFLSKCGQLGEYSNQAGRWACIVNHGGRKYKNEKSKRAF